MVLNHSPARNSVIYALVLIYFFRARWVNPGIFFALGVLGDFSNQRLEFFVLVSSSNSRRFPALCKATGPPAFFTSAENVTICIHSCAHGLAPLLAGAEGPAASRYRPVFRVPSRITSPASSKGLSKSIAPCRETPMVSQISAGVIGPRSRRNCSKSSISQVFSQPVAKCDRISFEFDFLKK